MTPEEKAVVQAAIRLRQAQPGRDVRERVALEEAAWQLIISCTGCSTETHLCPGCGDPVPHGDIACDACTQASDFMRNADVPPPFAAVPDASNPMPPTWVATTWRYARAGDTVRIGTATAEVVSASTNKWHVDPNSNTYRPEPWEHEETTVMLAGRTKALTFDPNAPVEILMDAERRAIHNLSTGVDNVTEVRDAS